MTDDLVMQAYSRTLVTVHEIQRYAGCDFDIITYALKVNVYDLGLIGVPLYRAQQNVDAFAIELHFENRSVKLVTSEVVENLVVVQSDGLSVSTTAIQNCWDLTRATQRSEEHTSELQSRGHLVCRLLLE